MSATQRANTLQLVRQPAVRFGWQKGEKDKKY